MTTPVDVASLLNLLESQEIGTAREIKELILENLANVKEAWLVNGLVDYYVQTQSQKSLEILAKVSEPHEKQLLDRITDHLKGPHKLQGLMLLGHMVRVQSPWLHNVVQHSVLGLIIKIIKTEVDVPIIMSAVLLITSLLPLIPVSVTQHLHDIFDGFARLAAFNLKKPGAVPDVYLLHLQVGIYSLFHRLYGMYPCHFLTYLRAVYSKKENTQVFEETIKPMLERVRMHPLLVTATKDKEVSRDRWKHLDVHDIVIDCAKLSLDMIEGSKEDVCCPVVGVHKFQHVTNTAARKKMSAITNELKNFGNVQFPDVVGLGSEFTKPIVEAVDRNSFFSPSASYGLYTPPPSTPGAADGQGNIMTPLRMTPGYTPVHESPLPTDLEFRDKNSGSVTKKRLSGISLSLAGQMPINPPGGGSWSVPPSPLKPDFTSEPPFQVPRMQAIRKIDFQQAQHSSQTTQQLQQQQQVSFKAQQQQPIKTEQQILSQQQQNFTSTTTETTITEDKKPRITTASKTPATEQESSSVGSSASGMGHKVLMRQPTLGSPSALFEAEQACRGSDKQGEIASKTSDKNDGLSSSSKQVDVGKIEGTEKQSIDRKESSSTEQPEKNVVKKQSSLEEQLKQQQQPFPVEHKKLSRKPSAKRQRSTEGSAFKTNDPSNAESSSTPSAIDTTATTTTDQAAHNSSAFKTNDPSNAESSSTPSAIDTNTSTTTDHAAQQILSPNAKETPIKIPGKRVGFESESHQSHLSHSVPSVIDLPHFIESLGSAEDAKEEADDEVSALTESHYDDSSLSSSGYTDSDLTAESVQQFMKNVNRIRFNSMNVNTRERVERLERIPKPNLRPTSCPDFEKGSEEDIIGEDQESECIEMTPLGDREESTVKVKWAAESQIEMVTTVTTHTSVNVVSSSKATIASQTSFGNLKELENDDLEENDEEVESYIPYNHMFPMAMPFAPFMQCYNCARQNKESEEQSGSDGTLEGKSQATVSRIVAEIPYFSTLSPPELLDRHIQMGSENHANKLAQMSNKDSANTSQLGGALEEVTILRGQLLLLHNQLMYERHKREMYAKRNRRLLGRIVKTTALEEQTVAMRDQLVLQENEIHKYSVSMKLYQDQKKQLENGVEKLMYEKDTAQRNFKEETDKLKRMNTELASQGQQQKADNDTLFKEVQATKAQLFNTENELASVKLRADFANDLQAQLARLNKELLLMGELQQKYQQRLVSVSSSQNSNAENKFLLESMNEELKSTKLTLEEKTILYDAAKGRLSDIEDHVKNKDTALNELKTLLENQKELHIGQMQALDSKYKNERKIQQALQGYVLELKAQMHSQEAPTKPPAETDGLDNDEEPSVSHQQNVDEDR